MELTPQGSQAFRLVFGVWPAGQFVQAGWLAFENCPAGHAVHPAVSPANLPNPGSQETHAVLPGLASIFAPQGVQTAPAVDELQALHAVQSIPLRELCPSGQDPHVAWPAAENLPRVQALQMMPSVENVPAAHCVQVLPDTELPGAQFAQTPTVETWFVGQASQAPPVIFGRWPNGQSSQVLIEELEYSPVPHGVQVSPTTIDPSEQSTQPSPVGFAVCLDGQAEQTPAVEIELTPQGSQAFRLVFGVWPAGQFVQAGWLAFENCPAGHAVHPAVSPANLPNPGSQETHAVLPGLASIFAPQGVQTAPAVDELQALHEVQSILALKRLEIT
jgi:hypothetical protein